MPAAYAPFATGSAASTADVCFGYDPQFPLEGFFGQIGELRVWNETRSDAEIRATLAAGLTAPQLNLVGYYDLRDGAQTIYDGSHAVTAGLNHPNPFGYLGSSTAVEPNDPAWVLGANLTCNVNGNFRPSSTRKMQPDTTGQGSKPPFRNVSSSATAKHLSQLTIAPNPASGEATMHFLLRDAGKLEVHIQDLMGQARATALPTTTLAAGTHDVKLPLQKLTPGLYLVIVNSADGREVIRLDVK